MQEFKIGQLVRHKVDKRRMMVISYHEKSNSYYCKFKSDHDSLNYYSHLNFDAFELEHDLNPQRDW